MTDPALMEHKPRADRGQGDGGDPPREKNPVCSMCGKRHGGKCDVWPCCKCRGIHRKVFTQYCEYCKKCASHTTVTCNKARAHAQSQSRPQSQPQAKAVTQHITKINLSDPETAARFGWALGLAHNPARTADQRKGRSKKRAAQKQKMDEKKGEEKEGGEKNDGGGDAGAGAVGGTAT